MAVWYREMPGVAPIGPQLCRKARAYLATYGKYSIVAVYLISPNALNYAIFSMFLIDLIRLEKQQRSDVQLSERPASLGTKGV